jgi:uncharacterized protein involved in outer membrane biogenesis
MFKLGDLSKPPQKPPDNRSGGAGRSSAPLSRGQKLALLGALLLLVLIALWFVITSPPFIKSFVLPRASRALGAEITLNEVSVSPFRKLEVSGLKIQAPGKEPLLQIERLRARYSLIGLLSRKLTVEEITVESPLIQILQSADGQHNLGGLAPAGQPAPPPPTKSAGRPMQLNIRSVTVNHARVHQRTAHADGRHESLTASNVTLTLRDLVSGGPGQLQFGAHFTLEQQAAATAPADRLAGVITNGFEFAFDAAMTPTRIKGATRVSVTQAEGRLRDLNAVTGGLEVDLTPTELVKCAATFQQGARALGGFSLKGPLDLAKREGRLDLDIPGIDRQVLNLFGATRGWDFDQTAVNGRSTFHLSKGGQAISTSGQFSVRRFAIKVNGRGNRPINADLLFEANANLDQKKASLQTLRASAIQDQRDLARITLDRPMDFSWDKGVSSFTKSTLSLTLTQFDLADWAALLGPGLGGKLDATLALVAEAANRQMRLDLRARAQDLSFGPPPNRLTQSQAQATLNATYTHRDNGPALSGKFSLANPGGAPTDALPPGYDASGEFDLDQAADLLTVKRIALAFQLAGQPGGSVEMSGKYDTAKQTGESTYRIANLNQHAVRPWLGSAFGRNRLLTLSLNGSGGARYQGAGNSTHKADLALSNLVVEDAEKRAPLPAVSAQMKLDVGLTPAAVDFRECQLSWPATARAQNRADVKGTISFTKSRGDLKLQAESLDLTPFFDLYAPPAPSPGTAPPPVPASPPAGEPAPVKLPLQQQSFTLAIGALYLRDLAVSNCATTVLIEEGKVSVKPLQLALNGAPATGEILLDLGVPGYAYDLTLKAEGVPVQPLADSFSPATKGQYQGGLVLDARIKGAGTTGTSLQKNLDGAVAFAFTNASIQLLAPKWQTLLVPIATLLRIPELASSPLRSADANLKLGGGRIEVTGANVLSDSYVATIKGEIPIADVLTNSPLNLPVRLALSRPLAQKANLIPAGAPTNTAHVALPDFVTVKGTLGSPSADLNKVALGSLLLRALPGGVGETAGQLLQGVQGLGAGLLGGRTNVSGTNAPATNTAPNLLDLFNRKKKK